MSNSKSVAPIPYVEYTLAENMRAFDKLPKSVRQALHESAFNWSAAGILQDGIRKRKLKADEIVALIKRRDAENETMGS